jgi:hypothetical protein
VGFKIQKDKNIIAQCHRERSVAENLYIRYPVWSLISICPTTPNKYIYYIYYFFWKI